MKLPSLILTIALAAAIGPLPVLAQAYPERPIRVIVPNEAGGSTDRNLRVIARYLDKELGTAIAVLNVPGGGTSIGSRQAMEAAPDGYTVLFNHQALLVAAAMGVIEFGADDVTLAAQTGSEYLAVVVNGSSEIKSFDELITAATANPDTVRYGVQVGAFNHFAALDMEAATGADFRFVNTGGGGPTRTALLGGHIDASFTTTGDIEQFVTSGQLRVLAVNAPERSAALPDVPTSSEAGHEVLTELRYWWWLPAGVPEDRRQVLTDALRAVMANPELVAELAALEVRATFEDAGQAQEAVEAQLARMQQLAKDEGLR
ncbi:Bug family tripartite tricarboxylate transporter substrate binding protein [Aquamicrobium terrae]|uniref:Tripartite-type tricarboxylate transporter receptor subunit TctC n=1 Tax=Aquamicrobium terrae TaxID=1324945 RepID=A0ABV2N7D9_9HYPH